MKHHSFIATCTPFALYLQHYLLQLLYAYPMLFKDNVNVINKSISSI